MARQPALERGDGGQGVEAARPGRAASGGMAQTGGGAGSDSVLRGSEQCAWPNHSRAASVAGRENHLRPVVLRVTVVGRSGAATLHSRSAYTLAGRSLGSVLFFKGYCQATLALLRLLWLLRLLDACSYRFTNDRLAPRCCCVSASSLSSWLYRRIWCAFAAWCRQPRPIALC